jgi:hypothetical protein
MKKEEKKRDIKRTKQPTVNFLAATSPIQLGSQYMFLLVAH